ncbi:MAG: AsmA family protein [Thiobacillus sp.]
MPKPFSTPLRIAAAVAGLVLLAGLLLALFLDLERYKPRIEAAVSEAAGMEVRIAGRLGVGFLPNLHVTLEDLQVRNRGTDLFAAREIHVGVNALALVRQKIEIGAVVIEAPRVNIVRDRQGRYNFETDTPQTAPIPEFRLARFRATDGTLRYADLQTGEAIEAAGCRLDVDDFHVAAGERAEARKRVTLAGKLTCADVRAKDQTVSNLELALAGRDGVYDFDPITLRAFEGAGRGSLRADYTDEVPRYQLRYDLARLRLDTALKPASGQRPPQGTADFSATLTMRGKTSKALKQSLQGKLSLRGQGLVLHGVDLDETFDRFEASQTFNLVDVGAVFLAGPIGLALTKGHDFARILEGLEGRSDIRTLVSDWTVARGVLHAEDVAIATRRHRVALQGRLDLVNERFDGVTVALVDARGCAKVQQKIRGSFAQPVIDKPSTLAALTGPVVRLFSQLVPGGKCKAFYAGSVVAPQ